MCFLSLEIVKSSESVIFWFSFHILLSVWNLLQFTMTEVNKTSLTLVLSLLPVVCVMYIWRYIFYIKSFHVKSSLLSSDFCEFWIMQLFLSGFLAIQIDLTRTMLRANTSIDSTSFTKFKNSRRTSKHWHHLLSKT